MWMTKKKKIQFGVLCGKDCFERSDYSLLRFPLTNNFPGRYNTETERTTTRPWSTAEEGGGGAGWCMWHCCTYVWHKLQMLWALHTDTVLPFDVSSLTTPGLRHRKDLLRCFNLFPVLLRAFSQWAFNDFSGSFRWCLKTLQIKPIRAHPRLL